jgi:hypothetical protein
MNQRELEFDEEITLEDETLKRSQLETWHSCDESQYAYFKT